MRYPKALARPGPFSLTTAPLVLVVGMHRSGTSLLAAVLQALGVQLPGRLTAADSHNPEGYFEWTEVVQLQERLLIDLDRWWPSATGPLPLPADWLNHPATRAAQAELLCLLSDAQHQDYSPCWAIKDPRTSVLLPLWFQVAAQLKIPLRLLLAVRDPAEVVRSLVRRDGPLTGMNDRRAQRLWWRFTLEPLHAVSAESGSAEVPLELMHYGDWFTQPDRSLQRLLTALPELNPSPEQRHQALSQIRPEHRRSLDPAGPPLRLERCVRRLHHQLRQDDQRGAWPPADPPRQLRQRESLPPRPQRLAAEPHRWPAWLESWRHHPAPRFPGTATLAASASIQLLGIPWTACLAHFWLQRLPLANLQASGLNVLPDSPQQLQLRTEPQHGCMDGLKHITINLQLPAVEQAQDWLEQLRSQQAIWDHDPARVLLLRALGLPAHWLDPQAPANGWLQQPHAASPGSWSEQLGLAAPTPGGLVVLGHAGSDWDRALGRESAAGATTPPGAAPSAARPAIDYRPGWQRLITSTAEAALAQAGWLAAAAARAAALIWMQAEPPAELIALPDASARLLVEQPPLTPAGLRAQLAGRPPQAIAEERPSPAAELLFEWRLPQPARAAVVVSLFNYADRIAGALNSVAGQRQQQLELIVVDDASTDGGAELVLAWMEKRLLATPQPFVSLQLWRHCRNAGLAASRNTAFSRAQAPWCFVLDADNLLFPDAVAVCLAIAEDADASAGLAVVHPLLAVEAEAGMVAEQRSLVATASWQREMLAQGNAVDAMALVRRSAWEAVGGYTHIEGGWEDYDFWCKLIDAGFHGVQCPQLLAVYRSHQGSMSATVTNNSWAPLSRTLQQRHPWLRLPLN